MSRPSSEISGACNSAIFDRGLVQSRTRGALGVHMHKIQCRQIRASIKFKSVAGFTLSGNWITSRLPVGELLRTAFERTRNPIARAVRIFSTPRGQLGLLILNFCRAFKAAGKPSLLRALVQLRQKSTSGVFHTLFLAPVLSPVPVLHAHNKAWSSQHDAQRNQASSASGASSYE